MCACACGSQETCYIIIHIFDSSLYELHHDMTGFITGHPIDYDPPDLP